MPVQFFTNYIELLKDDEYHDITIEVGEDPNVKIFRAHKNILCYRSPYLRQILSSNKENNNVLTRIKLPNVLPEIFQTILEYIYDGILSLNEETLDFFKILDAADNLHLQELIDYLQKYLIEDKPEASRILFKYNGSTS
ncbi:BTB-domain-containing protein [Rhizophagus irregularis]|uniref:BTB-domain-containing protein n=1 Tax=Rhizophagus irregularis TaxID=588596 RepID=A0A2I1H9K4_9GLOM|nr:BTB-domain-containing protein [Rhizophagus irregularis]